MKISKPIHKGFSESPHVVEYDDCYMIFLPLYVWTALDHPNPEARMIAKRVYDHEYAHILQWEKGCDGCGRKEECANHYALHGKLLCN